MQRKWSRRSFMRLVAASTAGVVAAACQPTVVKETVEVVKEKAAGKVATSAPAPAAKTTLRVLTRAGQAGDAHREFITRYQAENPDIVVEAIDTAYAELQTKAEAMHRTGNAPDLSFHNVRWFRYLTYQGLMSPLDDLAAAHWEEYDFDDWYPMALEAHTHDGKLYGIDSNSYPTSRFLIVYNIDMLESAGITPPDGLEWDIYDWLEAAIKLTDQDKGIFGGNPPNIRNYYDWDAFVDGFDSHIVDQEVGLGKRFHFLENPENRKAVDWYLDFAVKSHSAPLRGEAVAGVNMFVAKLLATTREGLYALRSLEVTIGDTFRLGIAKQRGPVRVGSGLIATNWGMSSQTKHPDAAFKLLGSTLGGKEIGLWSWKNGIGEGLSARRSQWNSPEVQAAHPIWRDTAAWLEKGFALEGEPIKPFTMPWNLRHYELYDTYGNLSDPLAYGDKTWEEQAPEIQTRCQAIMDLPRP